MNLNEIKLKSKELFKENITNNMIKYLKDPNNDSSYKLWLYEFNIEEYDFEFSSKTRTNKYYHDLWNELIEFNDFTIIY